MRRFLLILAALGISALPALAQIQPVALPAYQWFDDDGSPLAGGKVCSYGAGTTTPLATYSDSVGTVQPNPIILDSAGRAVIYFGAASYKLVVRTAGTDSTCSTGSVVWSADNIPGAGQSVASTAFSGITAATNSHAGSFVMSGNTLDLSGATLLVPHGAGAAPTVSARPAYDDTANKWVFGQNGATVSFGLASSACASSTWVHTPATAIAAASCTQPAVADLSDTKTGSGNVVLATSPTIASPTLSGTTAAATVTASAIVTADQFAATNAMGNQITRGGETGTFVIADTSDNLSFICTANCGTAGATFDVYTQGHRVGSLTVGP